LKIYIVKPKSKIKTWNNSIDSSCRFLFILDVVVIDSLFVQSV